MANRRKILITAGPTREMLDPVRFISNVSTGEMGYQLARAARRKKYDVTLISGPTALKPPPGVRFLPVVSARDLKIQCEKFFFETDVLVMVAAVCDFTADRKHVQKIHRTRTRALRLKRTPDIVASLARRKAGRTVIGFCLETERWLENARSKVRRKSLDGIVANYYTSKHVPFGDRRINTAFVDKDLTVRHFKGKTKPDVANALLCWVAEIEKKKSFAGARNRI